MTCATPGCDNDPMPERDLCAACVWEAMAEKARSASPPRPRQYASPDDDPGEEMQEGGVT